jgi:hypothetical protein
MQLNGIREAVQTSNSSKEREGRDTSPEGQARKRTKRKLATQMVVNLAGNTQIK